MMAMTTRLERAIEEQTQIDQQLRHLQEQRATFLQAWADQYQQLEQCRWQIGGQIALLRELVASTPEAPPCDSP